MARVKMKLDLATLQNLQTEAVRKGKKAEREFNKYDNHEDMREMENWQHAVDWLQEKLNGTR